MSSLTARLAAPLALGLTAVAAALPSPAQAGAAPCAHADVIPGARPAPVLRQTVLCLLNRQRAAHRLPALRLTPRLTVASLRHARDMVERRYFAHDSRDGTAFSARILRTGYGRSGFRLLGENLAWGAGATGAPAAIVTAWMASPPHRANILHGTFREIGIAIAPGTPTGLTGATYTTDFGRR